MGDKDGLYEAFSSVQPVCSAGHVAALAQIRNYIRNKTCYDILPESFRTICLDTRLSIRAAIHAMYIHGVVSAPLYDVTGSQFAGMMTLTDAIHVIQYYYHVNMSWDDVHKDVDLLQLSQLREVESIIDVAPPPTVSIHPDQSVYDACAALVRTHARRIPVIDQDEDSNKDLILSVLTQYRVLKFIAINCYYNALRLTETIGDLGIGTYIFSFGRGAPRPVVPPSRIRARSRSVVRTPALGESAAAPTDSPESPAPEGEDPLAWAAPLAVATLDTTIFDIVHLFSERGISAIPIVDAEGRVINLYESVDIVELVREGAYRHLGMTVREALQRRPANFPGVVVCTPEDTLAAILDHIRARRIHRMVIVEGDLPAGGGDDASASPASLPPGTPPRQVPARLPGRLVGLLCLSDVLRYLVGANRSDFRGYEIEGLGFRPAQALDATARVPRASPPAL